MKLFKRLTALMLSVVMVLSMGVSAFATEGEPVVYDWRIDGQEDSPVTEISAYPGEKIVLKLFGNGQRVSSISSEQVQMTTDANFTPELKENKRVEVMIAKTAAVSAKTTVTFTDGTATATVTLTVIEKPITETVTINKVNSNSNLTDVVLIDLSEGNTKRFAPGDYTRFALVVNSEAQSLKDAVVTVEGAEGETNTDASEWIINNDSFAALRVPYDAKTGTVLKFESYKYTFCFEVKDGSHVYTLQALVDDDWVAVGDDFTITGDTTIRALRNGEAVELVNNGGRGTLSIRNEDLTVNQSVETTNNGADGTVTLKPVTSNSDLYLYYGVSKIDSDEFKNQVGKAFLGKIHIGTIEGDSSAKYTFSINGTEVSENTQTLTDDQLNTPMTIQLTDAEGNPVDHSKISFGGVFKDVVVAEDKTSLSITPMGNTQVNYEVKDDSNTTQFSITLRLNYPDSPAYFVSGQDGEVVTEITVENLESIKLGLQYGYGINNYKTSEFTILDSEGKDVTVRGENNLVSCDAFGFTAGASYGITLEFNSNVTPSGTYTLKFDRASENHHAELKIIFNIPEIGYGLYDDERNPMTSMPTGSATGNITTQKTALKVWELMNGKPTTDVTAQIKSVDNIIVEDTRNLVSAEDAAKCLSIEKVEGAWNINTTPHQEGNYKASFDITLTNGTVKTFTVTYLVNSGVGSSSIVYNVGASDSIQSAIDKAVASNTQIVSHNIILQEGATYSENLTLTVAGGHQAKIDIIGNGATLNGTITYTTPENYDEQEVVIRDLNIKADSNSTAITINGNIEELFLQNVTIDGAKVGISGLPMASETRNVTISNCETALAPIGTLYDISKHTLREWNFIDNDVAIDLNGANGQFKIRDSQFSGNNKNIVADNTSCAVVNAAFNNYLHDGVNPGESIDSYFSMKDDNAKYLYSPYTCKSALSRTATSDFYIDPAQMNGLIIDAKEAEQVVNSSNFKNQNIVIDIVETIENESTGFTTSKAYATWNFGTDVTANAVAMDFTPRIDRELSETSQSVVKSYDEITSYQPVSFAHSGDLPTVATVELNETTALSGKLYLYKVVDGELVLQEEGVIYDSVNGIYTFDRPTCSDYIITDTEIKEETGSGNEGGSNEGEQGGTENEDDSGNKPESGDSNQNDDSFTPSDDNTNDYISVGDVEDKLDTTKGDKVTISVVSKDKIAKKAFEKLTESGKTLILKGNGYTWTIDGDDIDGKLTSSYFKTGVSKNSPHKAKVQKLADGVEYQIIYTEHHGKLPGKFTLTLKVDEKLRNTPLYLYYFNPQTGEAEAMTSGLRADSKGYVNIVFDDHLSTYFLTDKALTGSVDTSSVDKVNPSTGADSMISAVSALALCSISCAAFLSWRKR